MTETISRRRFLEATTLAAAATAVGAVHAQGPLPQRRFGRSGLQVSVLAFGCGSRFLMYRDEQDAAAVLNHAIDSGITYVDTAVGYGNGESERRVGLVMKTRRNDVRLATKIPESARDRDGALRVVEASLKRLQTDHLDVIHVHSLSDAADLARIEAPDGVLKALYQLRDQKVTRCVGITSHTDGAVMARAIEHNDLDAVQMAMNPARANHFEELGARRRDEERPRYCLYEGDRAGKARRRRRGPDEHGVAAALRAQPAGQHGGRRDAETGLP